VTVDDIDLGYHVRSIALPAPGSRDQLMDMIGHLYVFEPLLTEVTEVRVSSYCLHQGAVDQEPLFVRVVLDQHSHRHPASRSGHRWDDEGGFILNAAMPAGCNGFGFRVKDIYWRVPV
jgi:hypothetical protein